MEATFRETSAAIFFVMESGLGYTVWDNCTYSATPLTELVGWHVFDGLKFDPARGIQVPADNDAIVNLNLGVRIRTTPCGCSCQSNSLFIGYGVPLTDETWYQDVWRVELNWAL